MPSIRVSWFPLKFNSTRLTSDVRLDDGSILWMALRWRLRERRCVILSRPLMLARLVIPLATAERRAGDEEDEDVCS